MASRLNLQKLLEDILGSRNVYYQPPSSVRMKYPAIIYSRSDIVLNHADNFPYSKNNQYEIIVVDQNPDSEIVGKIAKLQGCRFSRHYVTENINHDVFVLYF